MATDQEIIDRWANEPAPLLAILHGFHDRDGFISNDAITLVGQALKIPQADLYGTVSFYHHFAMEGQHSSTPRVCTGPICALKGSQTLVTAGVQGMSCSGRCDVPIPALIGNQTMQVLDGQFVAADAAPLPPMTPKSDGECVFRHIRHPQRASLSGFLATTGYEGLKKAATMTGQEIIDEVSSSGLAGRGGAGFPTGRKWQAVADAPGHPKSIVCNADEGEPGCFKDRALMDHDPHGLIEGMAIASLATGSARGFIYLRYEYPETEKILEKAIAEAQAADFLGPNILGSGHEFQLHLRRGGGAYICGEETSLLNSLEGKHPFPRNRPPFPVTHGFEDLPTAVNNVETLAGIGPILREGGDWYRNLGLGDNAGTKVISLSGDIVCPGNYEVPLGMPLKSLIEEWAGGVVQGRKLQAVTMAGLSGGFLDAQDVDEVTLDEGSIRSKGSFLGAGGIMVFDDSRDMVEIAAMAMSFFAHESCGKCFPCRIGTQRLNERLSGAAGPTNIETWKAEVEDVGEVMKATSACGLGIAAPLITDSLIRRFPDQISGRFETEKA